MRYRNAVLSKDALAVPSAVTGVEFELRLVVADGQSLAYGVSRELSSIAVKFS